MNGLKTLIMVLERSVSALWLILFCSFCSFAQLDTSFWFVAPEVCQSNNPNNFDRPIKLVISSFQNTPVSVTVTQPANSSFVPIQETVPAMGNVSVDLTSFITSIETSPANTVLNTGLHLVSSAPVNVYYEVGLTGVNPEIYALKGRSALGTVFVMPGQNEYMNGETYSPTPLERLDIVATQNGTVVTVTPRIAIQGHAAGNPFTITLNAGQTYSCVATGCQPANHFQGTTITSNHPIAVTVSDDLLHHPSGGQDLVGDQTVPVENAGTEFVAIKGALYQDADKIYVTAIQNGTHIFVNGGTTAVATINAGETQVVSTNAQTLYLTTNHPVYTFQLTGLGHEFGGAVLPSVSHTGSKNVSYKRGGNSSNTLKFNIITRNGNQGNFTLNGSSSVITPNLFAPVAGTNGSWVYASIELPVSVVNVNTTAVVANTGLFHLGVFEGGYQGGCSYAFFSDYQRYIRTDADMYVACAGDNITINIISSGENQTVNWFASEQGSNIIHTGNSYTVTKNADSVQYVYAQLYVGNDPYGDRLRIPVLLTTLCGNDTDGDCEGTILFHQDFGGNDVSLPWISPTDFIGGYSELIFSGTSTYSGHYSLVKKCPETWAVQPNYDHTYVGNQDIGYMMYLDPGPNQMNSVLYEMPIRDLCDNAKLNFSFWVTDLQRNYAHPMFEMQLINLQDSSILVRSEVFTVPRNNPLVWHQYGFPFILPNNVHNVAFRIINKNIDNIGNDWAIDDVKVTYCGGIVRILSSMVDTVCLGDEARLISQFVPIDGTLSGATMEYEWQYSADGNTWQNLANSNSAQYSIPAVTGTHAGYYRVHIAEDGLLATPCSFYSDHIQLMVEDCAVPPCDTSHVADTVCWGDTYHNHGLTLSANETMFDDDKIFEVHLTGTGGCDSLVILTLTAQTKPEASIQADGDYCEHNSTLLQLVSDGNLTDIVWNTGENTNSILVNAPGTYSVEAIQHYCKLHRQYTLETCPFQIYVPNTITVSLTEGNNDYFCIYSNHPEQIQGFHMYIYNRWGELIYYTQDVNFKWRPTDSGSKAVNTIFVYRMVYMNDERMSVVQKGTIVVL